MAVYYSTECVNDHGGDGISWVKNGLSVRVASPLNQDFPSTDLALDGAEVTNPEQLLGLAWATCLNATAQAVLKAERRSRARVSVELRDADFGSGYEFHVAAYLSIEGLAGAAAERVLQQAHARCPVSKLLHGATTLRVQVEPYAAL